MIGSWRSQDVWCDLQTLIESVRISLEAPAYMADLVGEVCRRFLPQRECMPTDPFRPSTRAVDP
jgi:hypothetical protein